MLLFKTRMSLRFVMFLKNSSETAIFETWKSGKSVRENGKEWEKACRNKRKAAERMKGEAVKSVACVPERIYSPYPLFLR